MSKTIRLLARYAVLALAGVSVSGIEAQEQRHLSVEQKPFQALQAPQSSLKVDSWINSHDGVYRPGETLELAVRLSHDAHVRVFNIDANGQTTLIYPNEMAPDTLLPAGQIHRLPTPDADYVFRVSPPYGTNLLQVVATTYSGDFTADIPYSQPGAFREFDWAGSRLARHLQVVANGNKANWTFSEQLFEVVPERRAVNTLPDFPLPENNFEFGVRLVQDSYGMGEPLELTVYSARACQLTLLSYDAYDKWMLVFPNGWGSDRIRVQAGVTHVSTDEGYPGLWIGSEHSGPNRLIALCVPETTASMPDYDTYLVRKFMQQIAANGTANQTPVDAVIDGVAFQIARLDQAWATADFEMLIDWEE